jgi:hypothetical protein
VASLSDNIVDGWRTVAKPLAERPGAPVLIVGGSGTIGLYAVARYARAGTTLSESRNPSGTHEHHAALRHRWLNVPRCERRPLLSFAVLVMLWPRRDWGFSLAPAQFIATYLEPADGEPLELHLVERDLALHMGGSTKFNREQLNTLVTVFRFGVLLLVVEVLAWVMALVAAR